MKILGGQIMNKRGAGIVFILISAILYSTRLIAAALMSGEVMIGDAGVYRALKSYIGYEVVAFSVISLVIGLIYLYQADIMKNDKDNK